MPDYLRDRWQDIAWAAVLAVIFAVVVEMLAITSRLRGLIRRLKNKMAERSAATLLARIKALEAYRDNLKSYMKSDKALYLAVMRCLLSVAFFLSFGIFVAVLGEIVQFPYAEPNPIRFGIRITGSGSLIVAELCFFIAAAVAFEGVRMSMWDNAKSIEEVIAKYDNDIAELRGRLAEILR